MISAQGLIYSIEQVLSGRGAVMLDHRDQKFLYSLQEQFKREGYISRKQTKIANEILRKI